MLNPQADECKKFNREVGCTDPNCTFRHLCLQCNSLSHGVTQCPEKLDSQTPIGSISAVMSTAQNRRTSQQFVSSEEFEERLRNLDVGKQTNLNTDEPVEPSTEGITEEGEQEAEDEKEGDPVSVPVDGEEPSDDESSDEEKEPNNRKRS